MKRILTISAMFIATTLSATAMAGQQSDAVVGAVIGSGAGALIGHSVKGRDGALIGGAIGAITGVAIATSDRGGRERTETRTVVYEPPVVRERVIVREVPRTVVVHRHEPHRVVVVERKPGRGHAYGKNHDRRYDKEWKRDYAWNDNDRRGNGRDNDRSRWH